MLSCHTCLPTLFSPKNILSLISFILSMFGHCWRFLISQSNLNFWVGYGRNLRPWWTRPPRSCQPLCKTLARFLKQTSFQSHWMSGKRPKKQCDHEDSSTWKPFSTVIRASEKNIIWKRADSAPDSDSVCKKWIDQIKRIFIKIEHETTGNHVGFY